MNTDKSFINKYGKMLSSMKADFQETCPGSELLIRYSKKELAGEEKSKFEEHLDFCPLCQGALQRLAEAEQTKDQEVAIPETWRQIAERMDTRVYAYLDSIKPKTSKAFHEQSISTKSKSILEKAFHLVLTPKLAYAALLISMALGTIYAYALLSRPKYFGVAVIEAEKIGMLRGKRIQAESLRKGLQFFEQGKYEQVIEHLSSYLKNEPDHYQANYFLGLAYLFDARVHLLGVPYGFKSNKVNQGIEYLEKARSAAGENAFYQEDCLWYLGKAYLMLGELEKARKPLEQLSQLSQPSLMRKNAAKKLLLKLNELSQDF